MILKAHNPSDYFNEVDEERMESIPSMQIKSKMYDIGLRNMDDHPKCFYAGCDEPRTTSRRKGRKKRLLLTCKHHNLDLSAIIKASKIRNRWLRWEDV